MLLIRALIDQGSEGSFVSEHLVQLLRLSRRSATIPIIGIGAKPAGSTKGVVTLTLSSRLVPHSKFTADALVLPKLTAYLPVALTNLADWPHLRGVELADPQFAASDQIDLILGADVFIRIIEEGLRKGPPGYPIAQRTALGWILSGPALQDTGNNVNSMITSLQCSLDYDLNQSVQRFWEQEKVSHEPQLSTDEELQCEAHFVATHHRGIDGRYTVQLPKKTLIDDYGDSYTPAFRMLHRMEHRFKRDPHLHGAYSAFLTEYERLYHMQLLPRTNGSIKERAEHFYLPHHGVVKETSTTTKLRVVFNGSQRTQQGHSLNETFHVGTKLLPELADIPIRWRLHAIVFSADIEKMYRQIWLHPDDCKLERILWRRTNDEKVQAYELRTVTYGLTSAPYLALRTLRQLAQDESHRYPVGAKVRLSDVYVDDVLSGADTIEAARIMQAQINDLFMAGGFLLRKWTSNTEKLLEHISPSNVATFPQVSWQANQLHNMLGIAWHPDTDYFTFKVHLEELTNVITKRVALSAISKLFDPLGWLSPVIIVGKIFMQGLWLLGLGWDEPLPTAFLHDWTRFYSELTHISEIQIPRWLGSSQSQISSELHGFADASERAYAAALYLRTE